jgi:hypothetical protein
MVLQISVHIFGSIDSGTIVRQSIVAAGACSRNYSLYVGQEAERKTLKDPEQGTAHKS